jgi:hypothetical protein
VAGVAGPRRRLAGLEIGVQLRSQGSVGGLLHRLKFDNARSDIVLFEEYAADSELRNDTEAIARLKAWKDKAQPVRDALKANGIKSENVITKFKKAGILQNYVAYRVLCSFAHNQLTTLMSRHAGNFELRYHDVSPGEITASMLTVAMSILCRAVEILPNFTSVPDDEVRQAINDADAAWNEARS